MVRKRGNAILAQPPQRAVDVHRRQAQRIAKVFLGERQRDRGPIATTIATGANPQEQLKQQVPSDGVRRAAVSPTI